MASLSLPCGAELDMFRVFYCAWLAAAMASQWRGHRRFLKCQIPVERPVLSLLGFWRIPRVSPASCGSLGLSLAGSLASAAWGWLLPLMLTVAGLSALLYFPQVIQIPNVRRKANTIPIILLLLGVSCLPGTGLSSQAACLSLVTIKIVVVQVYLSSGLAKVKAAGLRWADGRTLRAALVEYFLRHGDRPTLALASSPKACRLVATIVLGFELTCWLMIPFPGLAVIYVPVGLLFHAATAFLMRIHYWIYITPAYAVFIVRWFV